MSYEKSRSILPRQEGWTAYRYLASEIAEPISLTLPLTSLPYRSSTMFPFFDGLIPEGWLLDIAARNWKLNPNDRMGLLMTCCKDCIGAIGVIGLKEDEP